MGFNWHTPTTNHLNNHLNNQLISSTESANLMPTSMSTNVIFEQNNCESVEQFFTEINNGTAVQYAATAPAPIPSTSATTTTAPSTSQTVTDCNILNIYNLQQRQRNPLTTFSQNYPVPMQLPQNNFVAPFFNYFLQNTSSNSTAYFNSNEQNFIG